MNSQTWDLEVSTLPRDHRGRHKLKKIRKYFGAKITNSKNLKLRKMAEKIAQLREKEKKMINRRKAQGISKFKHTLVDT